MKPTKNARALTSTEQTDLLAILQTRFENNLQRHSNLKWDHVATRLAAHSDKLWSLHEMERTGGEPDVVSFDKKTGEVRFVDCSRESPAGRQSLCYDRAALDSRKEHKPKNSVVDLATSMGVELLTEADYHALQQLGEFDTKTSSWLHTPTDLRALGGAIFGDRRYGRVFIYHNGAQSYYTGRGFRAALRI
jgi:hypothetical protein